MSPGGVARLVFAVAVLGGVYNLPRGVGGAGGIRCRSDGDRDVDWFVAYKLPPLKSSGGSLLVYMDDSYAKWRKLQLNINQDGNPLALTLSSIYRDKYNSTAYVMYNDETPDMKISELRGHTKGVLNFDLDSGFWLIHSVPKFPPPKSSGRYSFVDSGLKNGQVFLCISLKYKYLDAIGELLLYNFPQIYDYFLPEKFKKSNPNLSLAVGGQHNKSSDLIIRDLISVGGRKFKGFGKSSMYKRDLWEGIAEQLKSSLIVETWRNGQSENLPSTCDSPYQVENLLSLSILSYGFNTTQDHSKWAVSRRGEAKRRAATGGVVVMSQGPSSSWSCVGDINRQKSQLNRGGGAVCFDHLEVAANFQESLLDLEACKR